MCEGINKIILIQKLNKNKKIEKNKKNKFMGVLKTFQF